MTSKKGKNNSGLAGVVALEGDLLLLVCEFGLVETHVPDAGHGAPGFRYMFTVWSVCTHLGIWFAVLEGALILG
jgi:hypothetical protein